MHRPAPVGNRRSGRTCNPPPLSRPATSQTPPPQPDAPSPQPEFTSADVRRTIDPTSEVEKASLHSFPASDPPSFTGTSIGPESLPDPDDEPDAAAP